MNAVAEYIFAQRRHIHGQQLLEKGLNTTKHHEMQHARLSCPSPSPKLAQIHVHQDSDAI